MLTRENVIDDFAHHDLPPTLPKHLLANHGTGCICSKTIRENSALSKRTVQRTEGFLTPPEAGGSLVSLCIPGVRKVHVPEGSNAR